MTTQTARDTDLAWQKLKSGDAVGEFPVSTVRLELDVGYGPIRLGMGPDGSPQLLVPVGTGRRVAEDLSGKAVKVRGVQYIVDGRTQSFIELRSTVRDLDEAFRSLVNEVLRRLSDGHPPELAVAQAIVELRDLLSRGRAHTLEFLTGLFGELYVAEKLLGINPDSARNWTGAISQRHDFSGSRASAEIKSTLRRGTSIAHISSVEQLEPTSDGRPLVLLCLTLERTGTGGRSIHDLIESVRGISSSPQHVDASLDKLGLDAWRHDEILLQERFGVLDIKIYRVEHGFPRLWSNSFIGGSAPAGISKIEYDLDLSHASAHRVPESQFDTVFTDLSGTT